MTTTDNVDAEFLRRFMQLAADAPGAVTIVSGWRSNEEQRVLMERAMQQHGDDWRRWAAPPGASNHNHGVALDISYSDAATQAWVHANAASYGLTFPMDHEPWHIEPIGVRDGTFVAARPHIQHVANGVTGQPSDLAARANSILEVLFRGADDPHGDVPLAGVLGPFKEKQGPFKEKQEPELLDVPDQEALL